MKEKLLGRFPIFMPLASLAAFVPLGSESSAGRNCLFFVCLSSSITRV